MSVRLLPPELEMFPDRYRWTVEECSRLAEEGRLVGRYEVVDGEVITKMGQKPAHANALKRLLRVLAAIFGIDLVWLQSPLTLSDPLGVYSEPEPDVAVTIRPESDYTDRHPGPEDVVLVVEVADTSLRTDLIVKSRLYARAGIPEYWVLDLNDRRLHVHTVPADGEYSAISVHSETERVCVAARPDSQVAVADSASRRSRRVDENASSDDRQVNAPDTAARRGGRRRFRRLGVAGAALLVLAALPAAFLLRRGDRDLEYRGDRLVRTSSWYANPSIAAYAWISDSTVAAVRNPPSVPPRHIQFTANPGTISALLPAAGGDIIACDTRRGRVSRLPTVSAAFNATAGNPGSLIRFDDGIQWSAIGHRPGSPGIFQRTTYYMKPEYEHPVTLSAIDSNALIISGRNGEYVCLLPGPHGDRIERAALSATGLPHHLAYSAIPAESPLSPFGMWPFESALDRDGTLYCIDESMAQRADASPTARILAVRLGAEATVLRQYSFALPNGAQLQNQNACISPNCSQIAWLFAMTRRPSLPPVFERLRHFLGMDPTRVLSVWISRIDGSGMRELAYARVLAKNDPNNVCDLQWLPDGRFVSVRAHGWLWRVPVGK